MTGDETPTVIQARVVNVRDLTAAACFEVPWHQRRYDWAPEHVEDLISDLDEAIAAGRRCYFLGTVILVESPHDSDAVPPMSTPASDPMVRPGRRRCWQINDGQQRLVTLSLICARLLRTLVADDAERARLARRVLFDVDDSGVDETVDDPAPRLTPPRDDQARYRLLLRGRNVRANGRLTAAWGRIDDYVSRLARPQSRRFFDFLLRNVELACLAIPRPVDPNAVFETINCRGKPLEDLDLLRNHLYSYFNDDPEPTRRAAVHERLERTRAQLRYDSRFTDYVRCYFQFRYGFLPRGAFYRDTRRRIQADGRADGRVPADRVADLVADLTRPEQVEMFGIIASPTRGNSFLDAFTAHSGHAIDARNVSTLLRELRDYTVTRPLVFALLLRYVRAPAGERRAATAAAVHTRLANLASFVMRTAFVSPKFEPSQVERELAEAARSLANADSLESVDLNACLRCCDTQEVLDNAAFTTRLETVEMRDAKKAKRLLLGIEAALFPDDAPLDEARCTIEYVLPKTPRHWGGWPGFAGVAPETWLHRLGNLTLLHPKDRKLADTDQRSFASKGRAYAKSAIRLTRDLAGADDWSPSTVAERQRRLAALAARVWSFEGRAW